MQKFLDKIGLAKFWQNIKNYIDEEKFTVDDTLAMSDTNVLSVTTPTKGVTKSEFDAMTDDQKKGLVIVTDEQASDGGGSSSAPNDVYSTEEVRIGTWVDGKPLYRKVLEFSNALNSYDFGLFSKYAENIDSIVDIRGYIRKISELPNISTNTQFIIGSSYYSGSNMVGAATKINGTVTDTEDFRSFVIQVFGISTGSGTWKYIIILEYTKTTDEPETT